MNESAKDLVAWCRETWELVCVEYNKGNVWPGAGRGGSGGGLQNLKTHRKFNTYLSVGFNWFAGALSGLLLHCVKGSLYCPDLQKMVR